MAQGNIPNYQNASAVEVLEGDGVKQVKVWNNSGVTCSKYVPMALVPGWITGKGAVMVPIAVATNSVKTTLIGVPQEDVADSVYGFFVVQGLCIANTSGTVTANDKLQVQNATPTVFIREGAGSDGLALPSDSTAAVSVENYDTNIWYIHLSGELLVIT